MIQNLGKITQAVFILLLVIFLSAFQSVVLRLELLSWIHLDLILLVVIYLSLYRNFFTGLFTVILVGRIVEAHSGAPSGVLIASYLAVFLTILFTKEFFLIGTSFSSIILVITGGVVWKLAFLMVAMRYDIFKNNWKSSLAAGIPFLVSLVLCSRPVFITLRWAELKIHEQPEGDDVVEVGV